VHPLCFHRQLIGVSRVVECRRLGMDGTLRLRSSAQLRCPLASCRRPQGPSPPFTVRDRGTVSQTDGSVATSGTRRWLQARADLVAGPQQLRWRYTTDSSFLGRGVYVDGVRVAGQRGVALDGERHTEDFVAQGWTEASR